jgi:hypothetical protein
MATTTPNYGWTVPTSSDLVKNGATAIETLGDSVDDSLWTSGFGQAGKNKIINGDFGIWQRGTSLSLAGYLADRFQSVITTTTIVQSQQAFTVGTAPVAGYEGQYFFRMVTTSGGTAGSRALVQQPIEDVRNFAGRTATVSFWAKTASGTPKIGVELAQVFGSGGSSAVTGIGATAVTLSTSWTRYSVTASVPSISGKTIGTGSSLNLVLWTDAGSDFAARASSIGNQSATFDIWGVQVEAGSKATPFQTATGNLPSELQACQRYYYRNTPGTAYGWHSFGNGETSTTVIAPFQPPVSMRVLPTSVEYSNLQINEPGAGAITITAVSVSGSYGGANIPALSFSAASGLVANKMYRIINNNNTAGYLAVSAEL